MRGKEREEGGHEGEEKGDRWRKLENVREGVVRKEREKGWGVCVCGGGGGGGGGSTDLCQL